MGSLIYDCHGCGRIYTSLVAAIRKSHSCYSTISGSDDSSGPQRRVLKTLYIPEQMRKFYSKAFPSDMAAKQPRLPEAALAAIRANGYQVTEIKTVL